MKKPILVIMAAGMGSRYGGLKQMDPVDERGNLIIDFSIYDAIRAGFEKVIFIIKKEIEADFKEVIGNRIGRYIEIAYVYQELTKLPEGFRAPEGRTKPYGTGHAVLCCAQEIEGPFAVINADDYYGTNAFRKIYEYLTKHADDKIYRYCMSGYILGNTLTENGHVARGVCEMTEDGYLKEITERVRIEKREAGAAYTEDEGISWTDLDINSIVSMNMWGFSEGILQVLKDEFAVFLEKNKKDPLKCEFFLPSVIDGMLKENRAAVKVLKSMDRWYGVTYREDKQTVVEAIKEMKQAGQYPAELWMEA